jgi:hypothetical protein
MIFLRKSDVKGGLLKLGQAFRQPGLSYVRDEWTGMSSFFD